MDSIGRIYKQMLTEATGEDINRVAKQHPDVDRAVIQKYADEADPKQGKGSRYVDWLVKGHKAGNHAPEDTFRLKAALTNFEKYKPRLEKKDINQYQHVSELEDAVQPHLGVLSASAASDAKTYWGKPEHHEKIFDNGAGLQVYHTKTKEASKAIYGGGWEAGGCHTSWCTAGRSDDNRFDYYGKEGKNPLYQIHTPDGKVYQDEFSGDFSGGLRDVKDKRVKREDLVKEHPDLVHVPAFQGKDISYTAPGPKLDEALHAEVKKGNYDTVLKHPHSKVEHLHSILDTAYDAPTRESVLDHPAVDGSVITRMAAYEHMGDDAVKKMINHPAFTEEHAKQIIDHPSYGNTKSEFMKSDKMNRGLIDYALSTPHPSSHMNVHSHPLATDEDREKSLNAGVSTGSAFENLKDPELIRKHYNQKLAYNVTTNPNAPADIVSKAYQDSKNSSGVSTRIELAKHKNAPDEVIHSALKETEYPDSVREILGFQKKINSDHVKAVYGRDHMIMKQMALRHPKAPAEIHDEAISNPSFHGSISVSKSAKPEHLTTLATSPHKFIRLNVAENKNTPKETLETLKADVSHEVSDTATKQLAKRK